MVIFLLLLIVCILLFGSDAVLAVIGWILGLALLAIVAGIIWYLATEYTLEFWIVISSFGGIILAYYLTDRYKHRSNNK